MCGNRVEANLVTGRSRPITDEQPNFEALVSARVREARRNKTGIAPQAGEESVENSDSQSKTAQVVVSDTQRSANPYRFVKTIFTSGLVLMLLGYFVLPFAYVLNSVNGYPVKFEWRLQTIASLLNERADESYVFGPALAFMVGGHLWTVLSGVIITGLTLLVLRGTGKKQAADLDRSVEQAKFAVRLGRISVVLMTLVFTWQLTGMWTLERAADAEGGLDGGDSLTYFSLAVGSVASLIGISAFVFGAASLINRGSLEKVTR